MLKLINIAIIFHLLFVPVLKSQEVTQVNLKKTYSYSPSDTGYHKELKRLTPLLKQLYSGQSTGSITVTYDYPYTTLDTTPIPLPPPTPQIGTIRTTEFCSGKSRVELKEEYRYTADQNGDGTNDSNPQWVTIGFRELSQESSLCLDLDL